MRREWPETRRFRGLTGSISMPGLSLSLSPSLSISLLLACSLFHYYQKLVALKIGLLNLDVESLALGNHRLVHMP